MIIKKTTTIASGAERLWDLLTDPEKMKSWSPSIISDEAISSGPPRQGFLSKIKIEEGAKVVEYESEITCYEPVSHLGIVLKGGSLGKGPMHVDYILKPEGSTTVLTYQSRWQAHGLLLKLMSPFITRMAQKNVHEQMLRLKMVAEEETKKSATLV